MNSQKAFSACFEGASHDPYDFYQQLMTYWAETMQDDVYMIVGDGWTEAARLRLMVDTKGQEQGKARYHGRQTEIQIRPHTSNVDDCALLPRCSG